MSQPSTFSKRFGIGRNLPTPREHCKRCSQITHRADEIVSNYVMANYRQKQTIDRLVNKNPEAVAEIVYLNEQLAERDAALMYAAEQLRSLGHAETADSLLGNVFTTDGQPKEWSDSVG
jgi:hypothetical protein